MIDENYVLMGFAGSTDPVRNYHDGPFLHICRQYSPAKVYILLTTEMEEVDGIEHYYKESIYAHIRDYKPEVKYILTGVEDAHHFDVFYQHVEKAFASIKAENPNAKILVNISSGTPQIIATLVNYYVSNMDASLLPIQVATPENQSNPINKTKEKNIDKDVSENLDIHLEGDPEIKNRNLTPDLNYFSKTQALVKIESLLNRYAYDSILELDALALFKEVAAIKKLLQIGQYRKTLKITEANALVDELYKTQGKDYKKELKLLGKDGKQITRLQRILDYFSLAMLKQETGDISSYMLMLEPLVLQIYLCLLEEIFGKNLNELFVEKQKDHYLAYLKRFEPALQTRIEKKIYRFSDNKPISHYLLEIILDYYFDSTPGCSLKKDKFESFSSLAEKFKEGRNTLAHSISAYSESDFEKDIGCSPEKFNKKIKEFLQAAFVYTGYRVEFLEFYQKLNEHIKGLLQVK